MSKGITRRRFLQGLAAALGALLTSRCGPGPAPTATSHPPIPSPTPTRQAPPTEATITGPTPVPPTPEPSPTRPSPNRVVHVWALAATSWDYASGWYGDSVDQDVVDEMVRQGLMALTGVGSLQEAWHTLLPNYAPGQKIAIKVNFNNCIDCNDTDNQINGLIEPVNSLIRGMKEIGVQEEDIWVYDASRPLPARFTARCAYPGVWFWDRVGCAGHNGFTFTSADPTAVVHFSQPDLRQRRIADLLIQATYLINIPILKRHGIHPVTLGFKNHFGSIDPKPDDLHPYIDPSSPSYRTDFSPLVEIYANPNIAGKTILTVGDGLFGASGATQPPTPWRTFGNSAPSSLFFSRDPVAIDCVMADFVRAEYGIGERAYDYLRLASEQGLGAFERGDPWGSGYAILEYVPLRL